MKSILLLLLFSSLLFSSYEELLFNGNCIACHKLKDEKTAPSIRKIVLNYKNAYPKKSDFIEAMSLWVLVPKEETSLMHNAIRKYKLMPELAYRKDVLEEIASYLYELDFNK